MVLNGHDHLVLIIEEVLGGDHGEGCFPITNGKSSPVRDINQHLEVVRDSLVHDNGSSPTSKIFLLFGHHLQVVEEVFNEIVSAV